MNDGIYLFQEKKFDGDSDNSKGLRQQTSHNFYQSSLEAVRSSRLTGQLLLVSAVCRLRIFIDGAHIRALPVPTENFASPITAPKGPSSLVAEHRESTNGQERQRAGGLAVNRTCQY